MSNIPINIGHVVSVYQRPNGAFAQYGLDAADDAPVVKHALHDGPEMRWSLQDGGYELEAARKDLFQRMSDAGVLDGTSPHAVPASVPGKHQLSVTTEGRNVVIGGEHASDILAGWQKLVHLAERQGPAVTRSA